MRRLYQLRIDAGMTQAELSEATTVPKSVLARVEQGHSAHPSSLKKLADYFSTPEAPVRASELSSEVEDRSAA